MGDAERDVRGFGLKSHTEEGNWELVGNNTPVFFVHNPLALSGDAGRFNHRDGNDDYGQVTALFNLFDEEEKKRLYSNIAAAMGGVPSEIVDRQIAHFDKVHADYGAGVRAALAAAGE